MPFSLSDIPFYKENDRPIVFITGGTSGIGKVTVRELARHGARVYVTVRNEAKASALLSEKAEWKNTEEGYEDVVCDIRTIECDLMDLSSVVRAAHEFQTKEEKLDILINNAGVLYPEYAESSDGFETTIQVNYYAPYLLTYLLLPSLCKAATPRVINVSSLAHNLAFGFSFDNPNKKSGWELMNKGTRYAQSKLAILLFTKEMAKRHPNILSVAVHPGVIVDTALYDELQSSDALFGIVKFSSKMFAQYASKMGAISIEDGALTSLYCATDSGLTAELDNGNYYVPIAKLGKCSKQALDAGLAEKLWVWTEKLLIEKGYIPSL
ncbi:hypothetical protein BZA70DRAFT_8317 [Myxozyma melibiosi]|uniref:NAD(P)-binding protein n=1 Tax=Myxozyma melibiosi TaxID=54550 RepID=A0ABR1FBP5_9ASCO